MYIGTPNIVNDFSASEIAINFYTYLLNGLPIGQSLMLAKSDFYKRYSYDLSWITFLLYGNPNSKLIFSAKRNVEEEIRRYLKNKSNVSISRLANDLKIDISLANRLLSSISKRKPIPDLESSRQEPYVEPKYETSIDDIESCETNSDGRVCYS